MNDPPRSLRIEPRWPVVLALFAVVLLIALLPERVRIGPSWGSPLFSVILFLSMAAVALAAEKARWLRWERSVMMITFAVTVLVSVSNLANLIAAMLRRSTDLSGLQLLASSVAIWVTTILAFAVLYWQIDRGGPEARANDACARPDWLFPQEGAPAADVPPDWRPTFVDYLYLGYSTSTAFSSTDVAPLTAREAADDAPERDLARDGSRRGRPRDQHPRELRGEGSGSPEPSPPLAALQSRPRDLY